MSIFYTLQVPLGSSGIVVLRALNGNGGSYVYLDGGRTRNRVWSRLRLRVLNSQIVNLLHVHFEVIGPLEHLSARLTGMRHKSSLMLMSHMPQESAFQIENTRAESALELRAVGCLAHGVDGIRVGESLEP